MGAKNVLFSYIEVFNNRQRKHSYLGNRTPDMYESKCVVLMIVPVEGAGSLDVIPKNLIYIVILQFKKELS
jgi:hypothetical protein